MDSPVSNRQIINAIHEGLPIEKDKEHDISIPDKMRFGGNFARAFSEMQLPKHASTPTTKEIQGIKDMVSTTKSIRALIYELRLLLARPLAFYAGKYIQNAEMTAGKNREALRQYDLFKEQLWKRLERVNPQMIQWIKNKNPGYAPEMLHIEAMHEIIAGGINNVAFTIGAAFCAIPEIYQRDRHEVITPEAWGKIGASVLPLSLDLASSQMEVFDYGISQALLRKNGRPPAPPSTETNFDMPGFNIKALQLNDTDELCLNPSIIEPTREKLMNLIKAGHIKIIEERGGCPGRPIFPLVHARYMNGAKEGLFPFAEHILSLPPE